MMMSLHCLQATAIHDYVCSFLTALLYSNECIIITAISTTLKIEPNAIFMGTISLKGGRVSWI